MEMQTNGDILRNAANISGIPLRTLEQVKAALASAKRTKADSALARIMLRHGRLTDAAILWIGDNLSGCLGLGASSAGEGS